MKPLWRCLWTAAFLLSSPLAAFSDSERLERFDLLVKQDSEAIPYDLMQWLDLQTVPLQPQAINGNYEEIKAMIDKISKHIKKPATAFCKPENRDKNVLPKMPLIDETRTLKDKPHFYINANNVLTPLQEYIVGQAPLETTLIDFWQTILETDVITIVNLSMPTDAKPKPLYWEKSRFPLSISGWTIERTNEDEIIDASEAIANQRIIKRKFQATNAKDRQTRTITQFHYENWPDNGAPDPVLFYRFIHFISAIHPMASPPIFVHCAAGIGRSGTFVTAHSLCKEIEQLHPKSINIPKRIIALRMQRAYLVSTVVQYAAIYDSIRRIAQHMDTVNKQDS